MNNYLLIAKGLHFPADAVTEKMAFLGKTGGGKTYAAMKSGEQMLKIHAQMVVLDPVGKWHGLRTLKNGKKGFSIPVFGGLYGDVPLEVESGKLIADLIVDKNLSAVIDVSQFETDRDKTRFSTDFAHRFYYKKKINPSPVHLFLEESEEFIPQNPQKGEEQMLHAFKRIWKLGRNFGIGGSLISQRPQEINKKAFNQTECLFAFQMTGIQERNTIKEWIGKKGLTEDVIDILPSLEKGECWLWSPVWLKVSEKIKVNEKETIDISATPKMGMKAVKPQELSSAEIEKIKEAMQETIVKAKENDPAELKKQIFELQKQLKGKGVAVQVAVKDNSEAIGLRKQLADANKKISEHTIWQNSAIKVIDVLGKTLSEHREKLYGKIPPPIVETRNKVLPAVITDNNEKNFYRAQSKMVYNPKSQDSIAVPKEYNSPDNGSLAKCDKALLTVLAQREGRSSNKSQVALLSGYSVRSSGFVNGLSRLRVKGFLEGNGDSMIITEEGKQALGKYELLPSGERLHNYWLSKLSRSDSAILQVLLDNYPEYISRESISSETGYSMTSSGFVNALSRLRVAELIEETKTKEVKASSTLFE
jgi:hypothetical protein